MDLAHGQNGTAAEAFRLAIVRDAGASRRKLRIDWYAQPELLDPADERPHLVLVKGGSPG